jgi:hypothetical protein
MLISLLAFFSVVSAKEICDDASMFEPLVGEWEQFNITDSSKTHVGSLKTQLTANNCALRRNYSSNDNTLSFEPLAFLDDSGDWREPKTQPR